MYCKKCGAELLEGIKFCPECGEPVGTKEVVEGEVVDFEQPAATPRPHVAKCFTIFGRVGFGLSLAGFICGFIPYICMVAYLRQCYCKVFNGNTVPAQQNCLITIRSAAD